jgi:hypothetical protein
MIPLNEAIGNRSLSAWQQVRGVVLVQTREPKYAAKLLGRSDSRLVMQGVHGGYLRVFEFEGKSMAWAARLIERYSGHDTLGGTGANGPRIRLAASPSASEPRFDHSDVPRSGSTEIAESSREAALA